jgi:hypothetical protein
MFAQPRRAVLGVALISGVTVSGMVPAAAAAATRSTVSPGSDPAPPSARVSSAGRGTTARAAAPAPRYCASWALPPKRLARGERNPAACAATPEDAHAALEVQLTASGEPVSTGVSASGAAADGTYATFALGGGNLLATHYDDPFAAYGTSWQVWADNCGDAVARPPAFIDGAISSTVMGVCSRSKQFTGYDFTGDYYPKQSSPGGYFSLPGGFDNNIHSIRYG